MLNMSISELGLIFIVALLVFGPERLQKITQTLGRVVGRGRTFLNKLKEETEKSSNNSTLE